MSVKANEVVDAALRLICHVGEMGAIDKNREGRYYGVAPSYLTVLQYELAEYENAPQPLPVSSLSQELGLSDETALKVMPVGLAMYFALIDRDAALYNHFSNSYYGELAPSIKAAETPLTECYLEHGDPMMR
jgi:hypothetical protein